MTDNDELKKADESAEKLWQPTSEEHQRTSETRRKPRLPVRGGRSVRRRKRWLQAYIDALEAEIVMLRACNEMLVAREQEARGICNGLRGQLAENEATKLLTRAADDLESADARAVIAFVQGWDSRHERWVAEFETAEDAARQLLREGKLGKL